MNALPTGPYHLADTKALEQYFHSMARLGFDIACNSCPSLPYMEVTNGLATPYTEFASEATRRGYPACIQMQTALSCGDTVGISEAQYHIDNAPVRWGEKGFFASPASQRWKDYLIKLTRLFIQDYGYNWVIFECPIYRVDIPGASDRFHRLFLRSHPEVEYPEFKAETSAYIMVQQLKSKVMHDFCKSLITHAKSFGAERVGIMPPTFVPSERTAPRETLNASCDNGLLAAMTEVDFVAVRLRPTEILAGRLRTGDDMQESPLLIYPEVLSHCVGKPVLAVSDPTDETASHSECQLLPIKFSYAAELAVAAASPSGATRRWCGPTPQSDKKATEAPTVANSLLPRMGRIVSPVAFVFSEAGSWHAEPYDHGANWRFYWAIARQMLFVEKCPMLTFSAAAIEEHLAANPAVNVLLLEEHFPLREDQVETIVHWWKQEPSRTLIVVGSGAAYSANPEKPGMQPIVEAFPGLFGQIGLRPDLAPCVECSETGKIVLNRCVRNGPLPALDSVEVEVSTIASVRRVFGSRAQILFADDNQKPVITKWTDKSAVAYFCGLGSSPATAPIIAQIVRDAMAAAGPQPVEVTSDSESVLWNYTDNGYILVANYSESPAEATIQARLLVIWDVLEQRLIRDSKIKIDLPPFSLRAFRCVSKRSKLYDISGAMNVTSIIAGAGRADIRLDFGHKTVFVVSVPPHRVMVDGSTTRTEIQERDGHCRVQVSGVTPIGVKIVQRIINIR